MIADLKNAEIDGPRAATCAVRCALCAVRCALCAVRCALCAVRCALCAVRCALCKMATPECIGVKMLTSRCRNARCFSTDFLLCGKGAKLRPSREPISFACPRGRKPICFSRRHWLQHFANAHDAMGILWELFHCTQMIAEAMWIMVELGGDVAPDFAQPVEAVVCHWGWSLLIHGGSFRSSSGVMSFGVS